jgi:hypothetical protein
VLIRLLAFLAASMSLVCFAQACDCHDEKDPVKVTLVVILASEEGDTIDPKLKAIAEEVQKKEPQLKNFTLKSMQSKSYKPGEKFSMPLVEDKKVEMLIKHGADKDNRISLSLFAPSMGEIEYKTVCGKFLPIVTPCKTKSKERIILAVRVQPCRGE